MSARPQAGLAGKWETNEQRAPNNEVNVTLKQSPFGCTRIQQKRYL